MRQIIANNGDAATGHAYQAVKLSQLRCMEQYQLEPADRRSPDVLTQNELRQHRDSVDELYHFIGPEFDRLQAQLCDLGYILVATDASGIALGYRTSREDRTESRKIGLVPGTRWSENEQGTCGIATSAYTGEAICVIKEEHYLRWLQELSCFVAPISGGDGSVQLLLNATTSRSIDKQGQLLLMRILTESAARVENTYFRNKYESSHLVLSLSESEMVGDVSSNTLIAIDDGGCIEALSRPSVSQFGLPSNKELLGRRADEIFGHSVDRFFELDFNDSGLRSSTAGTRPVVLRRLVPVRLNSVVRSPGSNKTTKAGGAGKGTPISPTLDELAGTDHTMLRNVEIVRRIDDRQIPILLHGETGTGKGTFAQALHLESKRAGKPFVGLNCAAIPETLIESELFGYEPGTFTGAASKGRQGKVKEAHGGTLFLDEIGDMPLQLQTRLLRVLSEREVVPLGASRAKQIDIKLVAATIHDLEKLVADGMFREDLYYRLSGVVLSLSPLRQRVDKEAIIQRILKAEGETINPEIQFDQAAKRFVNQYPWPGNVRELKIALRYAVAVCDGTTVRLGDLPTRLLNSRASLRNGNEGPSQDRDNQTVDEGILRSALARANGNVTATAELLGVDRSTIYRRLKALGIARGDIFGDGSR